jgi:hypothetical protein
MAAFGADSPLLGGVDDSIFGWLDVHLRLSL